MMNFQILLKLKNPDKRFCQVLVGMIDSYVKENVILIKEAE